MGERIFIPGARLSYPHLFVPRAIEEGAEPKYGAALVIPKAAPVMAEITAARARLVAAEFPKGNMTRDLPIKDGDTLGFPGCWVLNTSAKNKPHVVDANVKPVIDPGMLYAGCFVNASVSIYAYKMKTGSGVTFGLDGIQFASDGERLDGRPDAAAMFNAVPGAPNPVAPAPGFPQAQGPAPTAPGPNATAPGTTTSPSDWPKTGNGGGWTP